MHTILGENEEKKVTAQLSDNKCLDFSEVFSPVFPADLPES